MAAGAYKTIEEAQAAVCLPLRTVEPDAQAAAVYERLYRLYRDVTLRWDAGCEVGGFGKRVAELKRIAASRDWGLRDLCTVRLRAGRGGLCAAKARNENRRSER